MARFFGASNPTSQCPGAWGGGSESADHGSAELAGGAEKMNPVGETSGCSVPNCNASEGVKKIGCDRVAEATQDERCSPLRVFRVGGV